MLFHVCLTAKGIVFPINANVKEVHLKLRQNQTSIRRGGRTNIRRNESKARQPVSEIRHHSMRVCDFDMRSRVFG